MIIFDGFKVIGLFILLGLAVIVMVFLVICYIGEQLKKWQDKYHEYHGEENDK